MVAAGPRVAASVDADVMGLDVSGCVGGDVGGGGLSVGPHSWEEDRDVPAARALAPRAARFARQTVCMR
ncbi:hypothetical protein HZH66_007917 [Vespula vulgaris]|uniref:Uncharacterized protein n=1 Tax=Vespula vulgaris TaxID=7454 RepID=A0A834N563_VESVU|nr:hypothetical protein HZH66_007917 [Vespula vulgaris]